MGLLSLNPFEFRAGLKLWFEEKTGSWCLNPFEFRAGLKPKYYPQPQTYGGVLIPLNSGLA